MTSEAAEQLKRLVEAFSEKAQALQTGAADTVSRLQTFETQMFSTLRGRVDTLESGSADTRNKLQAFELQVNGRLTGLEGRAGFDRKKELRESKAGSNLKTVTDGKGFGAWAEKFRNAMELSRPGARGVLHFLQKCSEEKVHQGVVSDPRFVSGEYLREEYYESQVPDSVAPDAREASLQGLNQKYEDLLLTLDRDLWIGLVDKSEGRLTTE